MKAETALTPGALQKLPHSSAPAAGIPRGTVESLRDGSHEAFEQVFNFFYARVKSFLRVVTKSEDLADEVSQKVFVNLWMYRSSINPDRNFNAYIYTMARNAAFTALKSELKAEPGLWDFAGEPTGAGTDDLLIARETELLVKMTVSRMPDKRKQVYHMSRYECMSNDEISRELNISRKVVEKHLRLALNEIREVVRVMTVMFFI